MRYLASLFVFLAFFFLGRIALADGPKLLSEAEIRQRIQQKALMPSLGLELFDILTKPVPEEAAPVAGTLALVEVRGNRGLAIQRRLAQMGSTGDAAADDMVNRSRFQTMQVAAQAAFHLQFLTGLARPNADSDYKAATQLLAGVVGKGADGAFDRLNQDYLVWWGQEQYSLVIKRDLRKLLQRGLNSPDANARLRVLHAGLRLHPVETRSEFWTLDLEEKGADALEGEAATLARKKDAEEARKNRMRGFFDARDRAQNEVYLEFLPQYLLAAQKEQGAGVARLIAGTQLRDTRVVAQILTWKLQKVKDVNELAEALWVELVDAAYSRFNRSGKLGDPNGNPLEAFSNQSTADEVNPEEVLFANVFGTAITIAEGALQHRTAELFAALMKKLKSETSLSTYAFVVETLIFHLDKKFNEESAAAPLVVEHAETLLTSLVDFLGPTNPTFAERPWRADLQARAQYVLEEAILRKLGWFPPTAEVISQAVGVVRRELQSTPASQMSHHGRAAFRLLTETPELFLGEAIQSARTNPHAVLGDETNSRAYEACVVEILSLYERLPPPQNQ